MRFKPLFGKQESLESRQESWNQAKISKDSRITSIKIQSCRPLGSVTPGFDKYNLITYWIALWPLDILTKTSCVV